MKKLKSLIQLFLTCALLGFGLEAWSQALFVPNQGQWEGDFLFKTELSNGAIFFEEGGFTNLLFEPGYFDSHGHGHDEHDAHHDEEPFQNIAYKMQWANTIGKSSVQGFLEESFYHNYFLGNDSSAWQGEVSVFKGIAYKGLYEGVTVNYYQDGDNLKYDILLAAHANPKPISMAYEGLDSLYLSEGRLIISTGIGDIVEYIPEAYQIINDQKIHVDCQYVLSGKEVSFSLAAYDKSLPLIIDPVLDFATFSGSVSDNWGFTATYDDAGNFYAGGISYGANYPVTVGAAQTSYGGGGFDISISKFNPTGSALLYATFIGGNGIDAPHSMIVNDQNELFILGSSSSNDFPTSTTAYQASFAPGPFTTFPSDPNNDYGRGANAVIIRLNAAGTVNMASTYLGSTQAATGPNTQIYRNYGDGSRGEIIILDNGNVAIASSTNADDLPFLNPGGLPSLLNGQSAIVAVFNNTLTQLVWGSYFGGSNNEAGYSLKARGNDLYVCGSTNSNDLPTGTGTFEPNHSGMHDGFLARFNSTNGQFLGATYIGTSNQDQAFMMDIDKFGSIFVMGQSQGNMPVTNGRYANPGSQQFIQKYSSDLVNQVWATVIGSGQSKIDIVPSAFMVDKCLNIYLSGWGGLTNGDYNGGNTNGLQTSKDAIDSTTDGSDFYFMVLDRDATGFLYGTFYGGDGGPTANSGEHVDGGTSRFSPDGIIYQSVCAACDNLPFPTTPTAYSTTRNSFNCNLAAIKISLDQTVKAIPDLDIIADVDTICDRLLVSFTNNSKNANKYYWDFGNGLQSGLFEPFTEYNGLGTYTITLVAEDTICDISDTAILVINHNAVKRPKASIDYTFIGCDTSYEASFQNTSNEVNQFIWDFGDGTSSQEENPTHFFPDSGTYRVMLIAFDSVCLLSDTVYATIVFQDTTIRPRTKVLLEECSSGKLEISHVNLRKRYSYLWEFEGQTATGPQPNIVFKEPGFYGVELFTKDPLCAQEYKQEFKVEIEQIQEETYIPNAFSPNGDGVNEFFELSGDRCGLNDYFRIFNRWGQVVFETDQPFSEFWNGTNDDELPKEDVYTYILRSGKKVKRGYLTLFM